MITEKVIVVLDCVRDEAQWTRQDVMDNAPDWFASAMRAREGGTDVDTCPYGFCNPTVYMSLEDFDADRLAHVDHFAPDQLDLWLPPIEMTGAVV